MTLQNPAIHSTFFHFSSPKRAKFHKRRVLSRQITHKVLTAQQKKMHHQSTPQPLQPVRYKHNKQNIAKRKKPNFLHNQTLHPPEKDQLRGLRFWISTSAHFRLDWVQTHLCAGESPAGPRLGLGVLTACWLGLLPKKIWPKKSVFEDFFFLFLVFAGETQSRRLVDKCQICLFSAQTQQNPHYRNQLPKNHVFCS